MNLENIENKERTLLNDMISFYKSPSIKVFNKVISELIGDLYNEETPDKTDEFFITLEGETWKEKQKRLQQITNPSEKQKEKQKYDNSKIVYSNPRVLSWIYAATREFPWLILESSSTLIIERAIRYTEDGFYSATHRVIKGPLFKKDENGIMSSLNLNYLQKWIKNTKNYIEQSLLKYSASGNKYYLEYLCEVEYMIDKKYKSVYTEQVDSLIKCYFSDNEAQYLDNIRNKLIVEKDKGKEKDE